MISSRLCLFCRCKTGAVLRSDNFAECKIVVACRRFETLLHIDPRFRSLCINLCLLCDKMPQSDIHCSVAPHVYRRSGRHTTVSSLSRRPRVFIVVSIVVLIDGRFCVTWGHDPTWPFVIRYVLPVLLLPPALAATPPNSAKCRCGGEQALCYHHTFV